MEKVARMGRETLVSSRREVLIKAVIQAILTYASKYLWAYAMKLKPQSENFGRDKEEKKERSIG